MIKRREVARIVILVVLVCCGVTEAGMLGPTGIVGDIRGNQINVTGTEKGSPADGKLKKGDVIVGIGSALFKGNARQVLTSAIDEAEAEAAGGKMKLKLKGNREVVITLPVLGSYSRTAPYNCPKSKKIITRAADAILKKGNIGASVTSVRLLGLLATGEKKYIDAATPVIKGLVTAPNGRGKWVTFADNKVEPTAGSYASWRWGYRAIVLSEYYMLTKDESVLPAIRAYAIAIARNQDAAGLFGHSLRPTLRAPGYGQMNQPSLSIFVGLLLARKASGIKDPEVDAGIQRTRLYVESHIDRGAFPYGVHGPQSRFFNNNGTSGSAGVAMALLKNRRGARYFSQLCAPTYDGLERGHGSSFFNGLWTPLGTAISGPKVTHQFFKKSLWFFNMRRRWDGSFPGGEKPGSNVGVALLAYCVPRKILYITGKDGDKSIWVKGKEVSDVVMASKFDYKSMSDEKVMKLAMDHFLPQVRRAASASLGARREKFTPLWTKYLKTGTPKQKMLAIDQYGWWIPLATRLPQLDAIGAILRNPKEPIDVRVAAAGSVAYMKEHGLKYYMDIVKLVTLDKPDDPLGLTDVRLGNLLSALCGHPFDAGLVTAKNKDIFYEAALKLGNHKRQHARQPGMVMLMGMPLKDFHRVAELVVHIAEDKDQSYHSYHNSAATLAAITILGNLNIKEGIGYAMDIEKSTTGKFSFKAKATWASLAKYGGNAKQALEEYKKRHNNRTNWGKFNGQWNHMINAVENDKNPKKLITLKEAIAHGKKQ